MIFRVFSPCTLLLPLSPLSHFSPLLVFWSHHQRAQGDCRFGKSRHKTQIHLVVVSKVFTRWLRGKGQSRAGGVQGMGGLAQCWRWHFGDKIPKLIVGLSTASQALKQKTGQQATAQHYTALHSSTQHYTALHSTARHGTRQHTTLADKVGH